MANYSFLDLALDVLRESPKPLTYQEIWQAGREKGLASKIMTTGKTPWQSLGAQLYVEVRDNEVSHFIKVGRRPARFFLKEREGDLSPDTILKIEKEETKTKEKRTEYHERDLHPLLTYFAYANPTFNRGRSRIYGSISKRDSRSNRITDRANGRRAATVWLRGRRTIG